MPADDTIITAERPPSGKTSPIVVSLVLANLLLSAFVLFRVHRLPTHIDVAKATEAEEGAEGGEEDAGSAIGIPGPTLALDAIQTNLNEAGKPRYLRATFELELENEAAFKLAEGGKRVIRDEVMKYLSGLAVKDTAGQEGMAKIQNDLKTKIGTLLGEGKLKRVYFLEFLVH
ncbi:MAG: flagellar basal body-associated FliL family protein [Pseudomonadota bacterium]